jgi:hypothetical protein
MLDWSTIDDWRRKYPATGVLRRRIEQAERDGALGGRGEIARKLLEEYAVRMSAKRTGI